MILRAALAPVPDAALAPKRVPGQAAPAAAAPLLQKPALGVADGIWERNLTKRDLLPAKIFPWGDKPDVFGGDPPPNCEFSVKNKQEGKILQRVGVGGDAASLPALAPSAPSSPLGTWPCAGSTFPWLTEVTQPGLLWEAPGGIGFAK